MAQMPSFGARGKKRIVELPEAASQTFKKGDFLTLDSNGRVQQTLSAGNNLGATTASTNNTALRIVGRAEADASGVTGRFVPVMVAEPGTAFSLPVYHGTPSSAVPNTSLVGKSYPLRYASGSPAYFALDISTTTDFKAKVVEMIPGPGGHDGFDGQGYPTAASTVQYGNVLVELLPQYCALTGAPYS